MVSTEEIFPCTLCGESTSNKPFNIGNKSYSLCTKCYIVISSVCKGIVKEELDILSKSKKKK